MLVKVENIPYNDFRPPYYVQFRIHRLDLLYDLLFSPYLSLYLFLSFSVCPLHLLHVSISRSIDAIKIIFSPVRLACMRAFVCSHSQNYYQPTKRGKYVVMEINNQSIYSFLLIFLFLQFSKKKISIIYTRKRTKPKYWINMYW